MAASVGVERARRRTFRPDRQRPVSSPLGRATHGREVHVVDPSRTGGAGRSVQVHFVEWAEPSLPLLYVKGVPCSSDSLARPTGVRTPFSFRAGRTVGRPFGTACGRSPARSTAPPATGNAADRLRSGRDERVPASGTVIRFVPNRPTAGSCSLTTFPSRVQSCNDRPFGV